MEGTQAIRADAFDQLLEAVAEGGRPATAADYRGLPIFDRLKLQQAERDALWRMTYEERVIAYRRGRLTRYQLDCWCDAWVEVPKINGEPEWIARTLADLDPD